MHFESVFSCLCPHLHSSLPASFGAQLAPHLLLYSLPSVLSPRRPVFTARAAGHRLGSDPLLMPRDFHRSFPTPSRGGRCLGPLCFQDAIYLFLPKTSLSPWPVRALRWDRGQTQHFMSKAPTWRSTWTRGHAACGGVRAHGDDPELEPRPAVSMHALGSAGHGWRGGTWELPAKGQGGRRELQKLSQGSWMPS